MIAKYTYDDLGQLTREDNKARNKSYKYTYDTAGNIEKRETYNYTTGTLGTPTKTDNYTYGNAAWGDLLTAYNGVSFTYDEIGNPLTYYNGQSYSFTWAQGRRLISSTSANNELTYTYNDEGIRTSKTINGTTHYYTLDGTKILTETWGNNLLVYIYDETGSPIGMRYRRSTYADDVFDDFLFEKNLQGDIVAVYNESGTKIVSYTYDAYGSVIQTVTSGYSSSPAKYNPFRYRGYYYDENTGFYYLNSRYYDPNIARFINADSCLYDHLLGYNLFTYCYNNPILYVDPCGEFGVVGALKAFLSAAIVPAIAEPTLVGEIIVGVAAVVLTVAIVTTQFVSFVEDVSFVHSAKNSEKSKKKKKNKPDSLPTEGEPNSDKELYDDKGLKQKRHYGPDGKADYDIDYRHGGEDNHTFPHRHDWDWSKKPPRGEGTIKIFPEVTK